MSGFIRAESNVDICANCGSQNLNTYNSKNLIGCRRRNRICNDCQYKFSTVEITSDEYIKMKQYVDLAKKYIYDFEELRRVQNGQ